MSESTYSPEFTSLQRVVAGRYSLVRELGRSGMGMDVTRNLEEARRIADRVDEALRLRGSDQKPRVVDPPEFERTG